ncbi:unnamed protein product [Rotaria sp. Silwood1]|nr:unnamed protein product [Rotaria sp. Silwood1]
MKSTSTIKNELIAVCKQEYKGNTAQLTILREFEQDYSPDRALWWYTRDSFVYRLMNKALRMQNIDLLFLFRFFIRDLEQQLEQYRCTSRIRLYRGQLMSNDELQVLKDSIGQLISVNSFLSTSLDQQQALQFLGGSSTSDGVERVLFKIVADPRLEGIKPFANISSFSYFSQEEEVLIMLGSIFRLVDIHQDVEQVWIIEMRLCSNHDNDLKLVVDQLKKNHGEGDAETSLLSLGFILLDMGKYDSAEKYFFRFLNEQSNDYQGIARCYYALGVLHNSIAEVHRGLRNYDEALKYATLALEIFQKSMPLKHYQTAWTFEIMGNIYEDRKELFEALDYYRKAANIYCEALPATHYYVVSNKQSIDRVSSQIN